MAYMTTLNPWANSGDTTAPDTSKINLGWIPSEQPPAQWLNYLANRSDEKVNEVVDWVNLVVGDLAPDPTDVGSQLIIQPPLYKYKWTGTNWGDLVKSVSDAVGLTEELVDKAWDQAAAMHPAFDKPMWVFNEGQFTNEYNRRRRCAWTDPKNANAFSGNFFQVHTKPPIRVRTAINTGARCIISGFAQGSDGVSAPLFKVSTRAFATAQFTMSYQDLFDLMPVTWPGDATWLELADFVCDEEFIYLQFTREDPASPGTFNMYIASVKYDDGSFILNPNWGFDVRVGPGGEGFTVTSQSSSAKLNRHALEMADDDRLVAIAARTRPDQALGPVMLVFRKSNGTDSTWSNTPLPNTNDYLDCGICSDGVYLYAGVNSAASPNPRIISAQVTNLSSGNPAFPLTPTTSNGACAPIRSDGHFIIWSQLRTSDDDLFVMKQNGLWAKVGLQDFTPAATGLANKCVAVTTDGTAFWLLVHEAGGGPDGLGVRLVRLDPTAIEPITSAQYLKDLQYRKFFLDTAVSLDWEFWGDIIYTGRDIFLNWTQDEADPNAGYLSRFANSNNR
jgi:hypothetical protein